MLKVLNNVTLIEPPALAGDVCLHRRELILRAPHFSHT